MSEQFYARAINFLAFAVRPISRTTVIGLGNIPSEGAAILTPNHISQLDPVLLGVKLSTKRHVRALAKASLFKVPIIGFVLTRMSHIPVNRDSNKATDSLLAAKMALQKGEIIAVYPEGTIPDNLAVLGPIKSGAARLSLETGAPIIPIGQWGAQNILPNKGNPLWKLITAFFTRPRHTIVIGQPIYPPVYDGTHNTEIINSYKLEIAAAIEALVAPIRS